ncbi:hypothetical protein S7711_04149 [Stachybotrys chartarum IBT 7711]|uniref:NCS1 nucleoside transporter n=1 Tax=Stachybotrys chartarum (strain CBS 109288 / IBT 7711) TaxID=1280523 RepID=A0A084B6K4_STACB|nr:hypothetical protein S7711_04149 [Stachybotrys chartarum IBT 7711]KFA56685.1 hypothetical protein S40293_06228 [Stachybotrys chartarum IBT 40293]KFA71223.1 hypothetical protein S40288_03851 [Stachybotrys chartarum IBT 40288]
MVSRKFTRGLALQPRPSECLPGNDFSNGDMDPVPMARRTWNWYSVGGFWISEGFQIPILQMAGSLIANGLSPGMAMGAIVLGTCLVMIPCALTGYVGAKTGLNYPVMNRACWGLQGSKFAVAVRGVVAIFWCGVQFSTGGSCIYQMLRAISPSLDSAVPNRLPESANITSVNLLCFFLFWIISLPFLYINVSKLRWLFLVKMVMMPIGGLALFIWSVVMARGFGPIFSQPTRVTGGQTVAFVFFSAITSAIGPQATFALNMGDFCRYAKSPRGALWSQVIMMPVCITLTAFLGVTLASASTVIYNVDAPLWNPLDVIARFDSRAAAFFVSFMFAFATLCTNIAGNTVAFGNDLMALTPKWVDVRRGQFVCAVLAVCTTPWNILASSANFLHFLHGYSVFLGPMCGIMLCDYWVLRGRYLNIEQLYTRHGFYWYTKGWNFRAAAAFLIAIVPGLPGLASNVNHDVDIPEGFQNLYTMNWLVGVVIAGALYYGFSVIFKIPAESLIEGSREDRARDWLLTGTPVVYGVEEVQEEKDLKE